MMRVEMKIKMNREQLSQACKSYHFQGEDREMFEQMARRMEEAAKPVFFCRVPDEEEKGRAPWKKIRYENYALCLASLGKEIDSLAELCQKEQKLLEAYMLECLSMEMLALVYEEGEKEIEKRYGLVKAYDFLEDGMEEFLEEFLEETGSLVKYQKGYLIPQKSVIYAAVLSGEKKKGGGICANCRRRDCVRKGTTNA